MIQLKEKLGTEYRYSEDLFTKTIDDRPEMLKDTEYALKIMSAYKKMAEEDLQKLSGMTRKEYQIKYGLPKNYTEQEKQILYEAFRLLLAATITLLIEGIPNPAIEVIKKVMKKESEFLS